MKSLYTLVGMKHRGTEKLVAGLPNGEPLTLIRERDNRFDANAVQVWAREQHVGYVKATENADLALRLDRMAVVVPGPTGLAAPKQISAILVQTRWWPQVEVET